MEEEDWPPGTRLPANTVFLFISRTGLLAFPFRIGRTLISRSIGHQDYQAGYRLQADDLQVSCLGRSAGRC